mmetsp:Transcript_30980/g.66645  ORF Transcript_30980/g.66645 Transcript_30980/m.66645 type:complete len:89 (-) Transcript_30980:1437-1703(-)
MSCRCIAADLAPSASERASMFARNCYTPSGTKLLESLSAHGRDPPEEEASSPLKEALANSRRLLIVSEESTSTPTTCTTITCNLIMNE